MELVRPFFSQATPGERLIMRFFVIANLLVAAFCAGYLVLEHGPSTVAWPYVLFALALGYFLADFASGLVHWGMDTWFDEHTLGRAVAIAREHHTHPQHILGYGFLENATLGSAPSAVVIGGASLVTALLPLSILTYCAMIVWFVISICLLFGTSFHNLCHRRPRSAVVQLARRMGLLIHPGDHWEHHRAQTVRYCVVNGWANGVCDRFLVWRRLERTVQLLTGAEPRRDDLEWQRTFRETGVLAGPQPGRRRSAPEVGR
jgi:ubiquitin-conjugating enzyme E2 variant